MTDKRLEDIDKNLMESNGVNVIVNPKITRKNVSKSVPPIELERLLVIFLAFCCLSIPLWFIL